MRCEDACTSIAQRDPKTTRIKLIMLATTAKSVCAVCHIYTNLVNICLYGTADATLACVAQPRVAQFFKLLFRQILIHQAVVLEGTVPGDISAFLKCAMDTYSSI